VSGLVAGIPLNLERRVPARRTAVTAPLPPPVAPTPQITTTLFYGSVDGLALVPLRREVPLADTLVAQGTEILRAQLSPSPSPLVSVIPPGTRLRAFYITSRGDAVVDLSREITSAHPGGALMEMFTVYALVNAVTANLPKVRRVQILVDGKQTDTIAGHVDVRQPLPADRSLVREN
jgi:hypothetical protein